jgi:hypothetical protein
MNEQNCQLSMHARACVSRQFVHYWQEGLGAEVEEEELPLFLPTPSFMAFAEGE